MRALVVRRLFGGLVLLAGAGASGAQVPDTACATAPSAACVLNLATDAALAEGAASDLMQIAGVWRLLGDANAIGAILEAMQPGELADMVRADLAAVLGARGEAVQAFAAAAGMGPGWRRDAAFAALAGSLAAEGRAAEAETLAVSHARAGAAGPVRRGLFEAALAAGDPGRAEALLGAMDEVDRARLRPQLVAALQAAGDSTGVARVLSSVPSGVDADEALQLAVAAAETAQIEVLLRRIVAGGGTLGHAEAAAFAGPAGDRLADSLVAAVGADPEALRWIGLGLAEGGHVAAARRLADRLAALFRADGDSRAAEAQIDVLWALGAALRRAGDVDAALEVLGAIDEVPYTRLDYPFPSGVSRARVAVLIEAGRIDAARSALAGIHDPFERAEALTLLARAEATDARTDSALLAEAAAGVRAVREVPTGFGGTHDAAGIVAGHLAQLAGVSTELELDIAASLAAEALARTLALPEPGSRIRQMVDLARALATR